MRSKFSGHGQVFFGRANVRRLVGIALVMASNVYAQDGTPPTIEAGARVQPRYVLGSAGQKWANGQFNWYYNPANQPAYLTTTDVLNAIQTAANRWSGVCDIKFNYMGITSAAPYVLADPSAIDRINVFGWGIPPDGSSTRASTNKWNIGGSLVDTDILINSTLSWSAAEVDALLTRWFGNSIGLDASNVASSILFVNPPHGPDYIRTLRGDDAQGCAALYGVAATADTDRTFNWAESLFPQLLYPAPSANYSGFRYRYYSTIQSSLLTKDGVVFLIGQDNVLQNLGPLSVFFALAQSAGF